MAVSSLPRAQDCPDADRSIPISCAPRQAMTSERFAPLCRLGSTLPSPSYGQRNRSSHDKRVGHLRSTRKPTATPSSRPGRTLSNPKLEPPSSIRRYKLSIPMTPPSSEPMSAVMTRDKRDICSIIYRVFVLKINAPKF